MELVIENIEVVSDNNIQIEAPGSVEVVEGKKDYEVSVVKKEYTIIGDSIFIPSMYEDAPPWLKEFIDTTISIAVTNRDQSLIDRMEAILTLMDYVPKNQYTEQINQIVSEDGIINSRIATLNSNLTGAINSTNATIAEINLTYASKDEAAAIAINALTASLSGSGEIGSALIQLQEAYADLESTTAQSISMLESVMEGEINGNATAMETIRTYVGIDETGASTGTGLLADIETLQTQVDGKVEIWYTLSTSDPKITWTDTAARTKHEGDMWYQTDTKKSYWYRSSTHSWNLIDDAKAIQALANAATAQATADGVVVSFYAIKQDTAPATTNMWLNKTGTKVLKEYKTGWINVAVQTGDTLIAYDPVTKDMSTYVYNGSGWITNTENGIVAGSEAITTLTANLSTTNTTVSGHTTQLNTVDTRIANGVASVETKWSYNSAVKINGVSYQSGFGLATSLTSGSGLPTGASEFWIKADKFKLMSADGSKKSAYSPFSVDTTTGAITFNGKVTFSNVTGTATHTSGTTSPALGATTAVEGSTYYNTSTKSGYIVSNGSWINNSSVTDTSGLALKDMSNVTTIDGGKITTGTVSTARLNVNDIMSKNMTFTGKITGGSGGLGGIIQSYNGKMTIDLVNGSIYIA